MIVLDTDLCIELLRHNDTVISHRLARHEPVAVSFMTAAELYYGASKSADPEHNLRTVSAFLNVVEVVESSDSLVERFGRLKAELERAGQVLPDADLLIAATALSVGGSLATGNGRHFGRIQGLTIEDWLSDDS